jgi:hypothetical protein
MKDKAKHILIFKGSQIEANHVKNLFQDKGIYCIVKDHFHEAILAGYATPYEKAVELWVNEKELQNAQEIINSIQNDVE